MNVRKLTLATLACSLFAGNSFGVVTYPEDDASIGSISRPSASVIGQWSGNASAVAVAPNYILTTRHQGGGVGTTVIFGGTSYEVAQVTNVGNADLRIARLTTPGGASPANLSFFTPIYTGSDAPPLPFTTGGFGRGRGAALTTTGGTYGYQWAAEGNTTLRFGRNVIDGTGVADDTASGGFLSDVIIADFDPRTAASAVQFEAIPTEFDSGSGWFVENGAGNWQVAGVTRAVGHSLVNVNEPRDRALFASNLNAAVASPDGMDAVRLSSYRTFINNNIPEPATGVFLLAAGALASLRRRR